MSGTCAPARRGKGSRLQREAQREVAVAAVEGVIPDRELVALSYASSVMPTPEIYCFKCREKTASQGVQEVVLKNGRPAVTGQCAVCGNQEVPDDLG